MKKILLLFAICMICSCTRIDAEQKKNRENLDSIQYSCIINKIEEVKIQGHIYLIYLGHYGGTLIHAEHCPCKNH